VGTGFRRKMPTEESSALFADEHCELMVNVNEKCSSARR
jgi:hypothetical protein